MDNILKKINDDIDSIGVKSSIVKNIDCDSKFLNMTRGYYYLNNDKVIERECIFNNIGNGRAVSMFAVTEDKKILLVIQPRVVLNENSGVDIEIPAGYVKEGEDVVDAGLRELMEETGYSSDKVIVLDSYHTAVGFSGQVVDLLLVLNCKKTGEQHFDKDEVIILEEVSLDEFEYLLNHNYIMDVNTKMGYYRYLRYLRGEENG